MKKFNRSKKWLRLNEAKTLRESLEKIDDMPVDEYARRLGVNVDAAFLLLSWIREPFQERLGRMRTRGIS